MKRFSPSLLCGLCLLCSAAHLNAGSIYYTASNGHQVNRANSDGTGATTLVSQGYPSYLDLDLTNNKMYWSDSIINNAIHRSNLDGTGVTQILSGLEGSTGGVSGVVANPAANKLYWGTFNNNGTGTVGVSDLDGTNASTLASLALQVVDVAVEPISGKLYWTSTAGISSMNSDGTGQALIVNLPTTYPRNLVVDAVQQKIYWSTNLGVSQGSIQSADLDGSSVATLLTNLGSVRGIAIDSAGAQMFWTNSGTGTVHRANLDGTNASTIVSGLSFPVDIAVQSVPEPSSFILGGLGAIGLYALSRGRRKTA